MPVPRYHGFFNPALQALRHLGGSASVAEIEEEVIKILGLTDEEVAEPHDERRTKLEYRLA
jgi:restriction system protein